MIVILTQQYYFREILHTNRDSCPCRLGWIWLIPREGSTCGAVAASRGVSLPLFLVTSNRLVWIPNHHKIYQSSSILWLCVCFSSSPRANISALCFLSSEASWVLWFPQPTRARKSKLRCFDHRNSFLLILDCLFQRARISSSGNVFCEQRLATDHRMNFLIWTRDSVNQDGGCS